jgi:ABC-type dipeptide/oligopeptide/nickel transport system ATPase component
MDFLRKGVQAAKNVAQQVKEVRMSGLVGFSGFGKG